MTLRQRAGLHHRQQGSTLIEQLMLLAIIGILTGVAVPSMRTLLTRNQVQVAQTDFIAALQLARETAITTGKRTLLCPSRDGSRCSDDIRWENGWLLFQNGDSDNQPQHGPLHVGRGYGGNLTIQSTVGRHLVRFLSDGSAGGSNITVLFCQQGNPNQVLSVVVSNTGRIRSASANVKEAADCAKSN
jgi:type IV fimbrial biogenesis protein FimT